MSDGHLDAMRKTLRTVDAAAANSAQFIAADRAFHWNGLSPGATPLICRTLGQLWRMSERYVRIGLRLPTTATRTREQHHEIFEAVVAADLEALRQIYASHLTLTEEAVREAAAEVQIASR